MEASGKEVDRPLRVLFVCLGNICRSPLAEGVFRQMLERDGLDAAVEVDSAGTGSWHVGEPPHPESTAVAARRGVRLSGSARQVEPSDLGRYDYVVAMDGSNMAELRRMAEDTPGASARLHRLREFEPAPSEAELDVPDPYGGGARGFERVHDVVEEACAGLLDHIRRRHEL